MSNASSDADPKVNIKANTPWNPWIGVLFVVIIFFGIQLVSGSFVSLYALTQHWTQQQTIDWLSDSINAQFVYILLTEVLMVGAIYLFLRHYKKGFKSIGLRRPRWSDLVYGVAAVGPYFVLYFLMVGLATHFIPSLNIDQKQELGFNDVSGNAQLIMTFISLVILPPIAEEILVRGFLYNSLKKALPMIYAVIGTSLIFAAAHLPEGGAAGPLYIAALDTFILSLVLIYLREKTGGLWASMTLHAIKNGIAFVALYVVHVH